MGQVGGPIASRMTKTCAFFIAWFSGKLVSVKLESASVDNRRLAAKTRVLFTKAIAATILPPTSTRQRRCLRESSGRIW